MLLFGGAERAFGHVGVSTVEASEAAGTSEAPDTWKGHDAWEASARRSTSAAPETVESSPMWATSAGAAAAAHPLVWQTAQPNRWAPERGPESSSAKCPRFLTRREHPTDVLERQIVPAPDRQRTPSSGYAADRLLRAGRASAPSTAPPTSPF